MNILHHKSWHVRTKKNIEKVRKDEQQALQDQIEKARKADIAEQERRIQELRGRLNVNREQTIDIHSKSDCAKSDHRSKPHGRDVNKSEHINFFKPEYDRRVNKAHELEKKLEQEHWEKKVGILTYLGGNKRDDQPWYERKRDELMNNDVKDVAILNQNDPLMKIKKELKKRKQAEMNLKRDCLPPKVKRHSKESLSRSTTSSKRIEKSHRIDTTRSTMDTIQVSEKLSEKDIQLKAMREKRLKREQKEARKSQTLFSNANLFDACLNDRERSYSNQFNPHLVRKR